MTDSTFHLIEPEPGDPLLEIRAGKVAHLTGPRIRWIRLRSLKPHYVGGSFACRHHDFLSKKSYLSYQPCVAVRPEI
jgi:hypothetical protein